MGEVDTLQAADASPEAPELDPYDSALLELEKIEWINLPNWQPGIVISMFDTSGNETEKREEAFAVAAVDAGLGLYQFKVVPEQTFEKARLT